MALKIEIRPPSFQTAMHIEHGLLNGELLKTLAGPRIALVADTALSDLYAKPLAQRIGADLFLIPSGEKAKTWDALKRLTEQLIEKGHGRDTTLVALGGGSAIDLVGFTASIYLRGVSLVLLPTTLLGMVDAAIGAKTGINLTSGKNLLGTVYPPKAVIADLDLLQSLPKTELFNGMAEIVKMGLIADVSLLQMTDLDQLVLAAAKAKIVILEKDPLDRGLRRILNFGHTIGHALEVVSLYRMSHGQAVSLGCVVESYLSMHLGYLPEKEFVRIPPTPVRLPADYDRKKLLQAMARDKKNQTGETRFVLIDRIGHAMSFDGEYCCSVALQDIDDALNWMEKKFS